MSIFLVTGQDPATSSELAGFNISKLKTILFPTSFLYVTAVQFIMVGSGVATEELIPDRDWGEQSSKSLGNLYWATQGS
jgi:hypothetical protein